MISSGNATVYVSDLDAAIRFYTQQLGLRLTNRIGDRWATIDAGPSYWTSEGISVGLTLGLRPASAHYPPPGTKGGVGFGFETYQRIEDVAAQLRGRRVRVTGDVITFEAGKVVAFTDLDGVPTYAWEFSAEMLEEVDREAVPDTLIAGGHAIVYVSDMDAAIRFYADTLGLKLTYRFENKFATIEAGRNLLLALHPKTPNTPDPGVKGSVTLGLVVDKPIDAVLSRLAQRGVRVTGRSEPGRSVDIEDLDGNVITLWEARTLDSGIDLEPAGSASRST
jgi:catechol 2,3-dioxygenase-like lactoylglutathione lyase family enzyme